MQDEEMDDIIRDAANQHHPAYDDQAWNKMEGLLDKHMPQEKDKRRYILFFLLLLLISAGGFYAYVSTHKNDVSKQATALQDKNSQQPNTSNTIITNSNTNSLQTATANTPVISDNLYHTQTNQPIKTSTTNFNYSASNNDGTENVDANTSSQHKSFVRKTKAKFKSSSSNAAIGNTEDYTEANKKAEPINNTVADNKLIDNDTPTDTASLGLKNNKIVTTASVDSSHKINDTTAQPITASTKKPSADKKNDRSFKNNFAITATAGPGLSYVGLEYLGKTTFTYGAGIAYAVSKKFTVRTGFYVSSKIYSANPSDYHPPKTFWMYYPNLQKVDANCKVYEIPVSLTYNFKQVKKHNWFAAAGLASYIMKNENYGYYSNVNGQTEYADADISNQNKNIFSILTFSGGYQYHINKRFSIMAEPFIELPLNGIGFGKINLNSSGLLFTIAVKPFK